MNPLTCPYTDRHTYKHSNNVFAFTWPPEVARSLHKYGLFTYTQYSQFYEYSTSRTVLEILKSVTLLESYSKFSTGQVNAKRLLLSSKEVMDISYGFPC